MQLALHHVERNDTAADAVFHHQIDREVLDEERRRMLDRLLIEGVQHRMTGSVRRGTRALRRRPAAELGGHATERTLINLAVCGA